MLDAKSVIDLRLARGEISVEEHKALQAAIAGEPTDARGAAPFPTGQGTAPAMLTNNMQQIAAQPVAPVASFPSRTGSGVKNIVSRVAKVVLALISGVLFAGLVLAGLAMLFVDDGPTCELGKLEIKEDAFIINGELDFGYILVAPTKNLGGARRILIKARVSTSEGEYERTRIINFGEKGDQAVQFQFHEPTVNARNIQARVTCELPR